MRIAQYYYNGRLQIGRLLAHDLKSEPVLRQRLHERGRAAPALRDRRRPELRDQLHRLPGGER